MDQMTKGLSKEDIDTWNRFIENLQRSEVSPPSRSIYGDQSPSRRLDLHGMTIHDAWVNLREFVEAHSSMGNREVVVITGRSGKISHEFTQWCRQLEAVRSYEPIETKGGKVGSYRLRLRSRAP
jgi:DNA-nicking Smr family endonuclease